jgi:hypothetical protein
MEAYDSGNVGRREARGGIEERDQHDLLSNLLPEDLHVLPAHPLHDDLRLQQRASSDRMLRYVQ